MGSLTDEANYGWVLAHVTQCGHLMSHLTQHAAHAPATHVPRRAANGIIALHAAKG